MEQITINLLATGITPVCHVSQFDDGRTVRINLKKGADIFTLSGTEEVKMRIRKPDNTERVVNITNTASSYVDYVSTPEDCDIEGVNVCELVVGEAGSKNFLMNVEEDAYGGGVDVETLTASGPVATFETNMVDNLVDLKAEITPIQDLHGYDYPWSAGGGKNLFAPYTERTSNNGINYSVNSNGTIRCQGTSTGASYSGSNLNYANAPILLKAGTYTISANGFSATGGAQGYLSFGARYSDGTLVQSSSIRNNSATITLEEDAHCFYWIYVANNRTINEDIAIQVEAGSTATEWTPYENICPITGHEEAKIVRTGKNLLSSTLYKGLSYNPTVGTTVTLTESPKQLTDNHDGTFSISTTVNWETFCMIVPIKSTTYYRKTAISSNGALGTSEVWLDKNLKVISTYNNTDTTQTKNGLLTIPSNASYFAWVITNRAVANATLTITQPQLELGSVATAYEPYAGTEVTVQFGQTVYKGYLDAKNSKVIATHVLGNFDGSNDEMWHDYPTGNGFFVSGISNHIKESYGDGLCNILPTSKSIGNLGVVYGINSQYIFIMQVKTAWNISTVSDLRAFLANNPLQIMYKLAEPVEIPLSAISQFETLLGINNVYSDIGDVELKYLKQV